MKYLYSILIVLVLSALIQAQSFELNVSGSLPTGDFGDAVNVGFSGGVSVFVPVSFYDVVVYGGYGFWDEKEFADSSSVSFNNFPVVLAGLRRFYSRLYFQSLVGIYPVKSVVEAKDPAGNKYKVESKETQFAMQGTVGFLFPVSFFVLDVSGNFLWTQDYPQIKLGIGFLF